MTNSLDQLIESKVKEIIKLTSGYEENEKIFFVDLLKVKPKNEGFYDIIKFLVEDYKLNLNKFVRRGLLNLRDCETTTKRKLKEFQRLEKKIEKETRLLTMYNTGEIKSTVYSHSKEKPLLFEIEMFNKKFRGELINSTYSFLDAIIDETDLKILQQLPSIGYIPIKFLGEGGTRKVYKVIHKQREQILALKLDKPLNEVTNERAKEIIKQHEQKELAKQERLALMDLTHENLARMYDFGEYKGCRYVVEAYIEGMTLEDLVKKKGGFLNREEILKIFMPLFRAIFYLEKEDYVHRDIKPDNILISSDIRTVKLSDLQNAVKLDKNNIYRGTSFGSLKTIAPELLERGIASRYSDYFSIGASMYFALSGRYPYEFTSVMTEEDKKRVILKQDYSIGGKIEEIISRWKLYNPCQGPLYYLFDKITYKLLSYLLAREPKMRDSKKIKEIVNNEYEEFYKKLGLNRKED